MEIRIYVYLHTIFCTSEHRNLIADKDRMLQLFQEAFQYYNCELFETIVMPNHVHVLHSADPEVSADVFLKKIKLAVQTRYQREIDQEFYWEPGYYSFSIGGSSLESERLRLLQQPILHKNISLDMELKKFRDELHLDESDDLTDLDEHRFN